jgi:hypothetical protein
MGFFDASYAMRIGVHKVLFGQTVLNQGTEEQVRQYQRPIEYSIASTVRSRLHKALRTYRELCHDRATERQQHSCLRDHGYV